MGRIVPTVAMALGLCGGLLASQGPEFTQQYRQRLGGAIDELRRVVARFDVDAGAVGRDREGALRRLNENADELARRQGEAMRANAARLERLESQRQAFADAGSLDRMLVLLRRGDPGLMGAAFRDYRPGLQMTKDGLIAGAGGFVLAWGGALFLASLGRAALARRRRPARSDEPPRPSPVPSGSSPERRESGVLPWRAGSARNAP
jgi:hypothetical protein